MATDDAKEKTLNVKRTLAILLFVAFALMLPVVLTLWHDEPLTAPATPSETTAPSAGNVVNDSVKNEHPAPPVRTWRDALQEIVLIVKTGHSVAEERIRPLVVRGRHSYDRFQHVMIASDSSHELWPGAPYNVFDTIENGSMIAKANASVMATPERFASFMSRLPFEKKRSPGDHTEEWKQDRLKNFPAFREAYRLFPDAKWYFMLDDDTFVSARNLATYVLALTDTATGVYQGNLMGFNGCGLNSAHPPVHTPLFGHGGSGILLSHTAVKRMLEVVDACIVRWVDCWAGDVSVSLCLLTLDPPLKVAACPGLHSEPPRPTFSKIGGQWCTMNPITFHHLPTQEHVQLLEFEQLQWDTVGKFQLSAVAEHYFLDYMAQNATLSLNKGDTRCTPLVDNGGESLFPPMAIQGEEGAFHWCYERCLKFSSCAGFYVDLDNLLCHLKSNLLDRYVPSVNTTQSFFCLFRSRFFGHFCGF